MAKKKNDTVESSENAADTLAERIRKKYGAENIETGNYILEHPKKKLSVCPSFDMNLGGGVKEGTISLISGKPKCGKTTLCLQIAKSAIEDGRDVFYLSVENRFSEANASGIKGLDASKIQVIKSAKGRIISGEDFLNIARDIVYEVPSALIIIDSTSAITPREENTEDITGKGRALAPRMFSEWCKSIAPVVPTNNTIILAIQHLITNTTGYGPAFSEDGGVKLKFQSDLLLRAKGQEKWVLSNGKIIGQKVFWDVIWSNHIGPKVDKFESYLRYGFGFDYIKEIINIGIETGVINQAGAWYSVDGEEGKYQGEENLWHALNDNQTLFEGVKSKIYGMLS